MSMLNRLRNKVDPSELLPVEYYVVDKKIELEGSANVVDFLVKKTMKSTGRKMQKKFGGRGLIHPETGERPVIRIIMPDPSKPSLQCRLIADSEELRAFIKSKGIVVDEIVTADAGGKTEASD